MSADLARRDPIILKLEIARRALVDATTWEQAKQIADVAAAAEIYARRQQLGEESIGLAHAVKIEALVRLGVLLEDMPKAPAGRPRKDEDEIGSDGEPIIPTYAELGLDKKTAWIAQQLAALPEDVREDIKARELTLTEALRRARHVRPAPPLPDGVFRVLYADPPWQYSDTRAGLGAESQATDWAATAAEQHYPSMTVEALSTLAIRDHAATDSVLFCWATFPLLPDGLAVVAAWGFTYKTAFVWAKPQGSFGHYHKADAELLLVGTRGSCVPDVDRRVSQIIEAPRTAHSRKPAAVRTLIQTLYTTGPYWELFARETADGWVSWGNEV